MTARWNEQRVQRTRDIVIDTEPQHRAKKARGTVVHSIMEKNGRLIIDFIHIHFLFLSG